jgi:ABC-type lipoprotein export system ATPase subunit
MGRTVLEVLQGISLEVRPGEKLFLCGPSGAGKTTLLYTLAGLEKPDSGDVFIDNQSLYRSSRSQRAITRNRCMGYVFQNYYLLPDLTALENVLLPSMIRGRGVRNRALELLDKVGLSERTDHLPAEMSGGEQQRTAIARALMNDPPIIFADEPTGNLDSRTRNEVMDMLLSIVDEASKTLIVVTHDRKLAALGDRCIQIKDGQINSSELSPVIAQS